VTQAGWLTEGRLAAFLRRMGYPGGKAAAELLGRLADAPAGLTGPEGQARATVTLGLVAALNTVRAQIDELEGEVIERLGTYADAAIFTALADQAGFAPPRCWPRSATAGPGSPTPSR
jgi:hypothetical protein